MYLGVSIFYFIGFGLLKYIPKRQNDNVHKANIGYLYHIALDCFLYTSVQLNVLFQNTLNGPSVTWPVAKVSDQEVEII